MDQLGKAVELALTEFRKEYGKDAQLEEGDEFATIFNDSLLIIGIEDNSLKIKVLLGEPYRVDFNFCDD